MFSEPSDPIPGAVRQLIGLFEEELADVEFPGVGLHSLQQHVEAVQSQAAALQTLEAQLTQARHTLDERRRELSRHAEQAVAYARVFSSTRPELAQRLASVELAKPVVAPPKPRGRPRSRPPTAMEEAASKLPLVAEEVAAEAPAPAPARSSPRSNLKVAKS